MCHSLCTHPRSTHIKLSGQSQRNHPRFAASLHTHHSSYVSFSVHNYYKYTVACRREGRLKRSIHTHSLTRRPPTPSLMPNFFSFRVLCARKTAATTAVDETRCARRRSAVVVFLFVPKTQGTTLSIYSHPILGAPRSFVGLHANGRLQSRMRSYNKMYATLLSRTPSFLAVGVRLPAVLEGVAVPLVREAATPLQFFL